MIRWIKESTLNLLSSYIIKKTFYKYSSDQMTGRYTTEDRTALNREIYRKDGIFTLAKIPTHDYYDVTYNNGNYAVNRIFTKTGAGRFGKFYMKPSIFIKLIDDGFIESLGAR